MKLKIQYLIVILFFMFFSIINARADTITVDGIGAIQPKTYGAYSPYKTATNGITSFPIYCSQYYKDYPPKGESCSSASDWDKNSVEAKVIGEILTSNKSYMHKEVAINAYLGQKGYTYREKKKGLRSRVSYNKQYNGAYYIALDDPNGELSRWFEELETQVQNESTNNEIKISSVQNFSYKELDKKFYSRVNISSSNPTSEYEVTITGDKMGCSVSDKTNDAFNIACEYTGISSSETITIKISRNYEYKTSSRYYCNDDYQQVFLGKEEKGKATTEDSFDKSITTVKQACNNRIANASNSNKIEYYKQYKTKSYDWRKILNFNNSSCDTFTTKYNANRSCNNINVKVNENEFNENNLSGYQEYTKINNTWDAYCTVEYNYLNNLPTNNSFYAGRIIFQDLENLGIGYIQKRCYAFDTGISVGDINWSFSDYFDVGSYVKGISILNQRLDENKSELIRIHSTNNEFIYRYNLEYFKINLIENISGLAVNRCNDGECSQVRGLITKFETDSNNENNYTTSFTPNIELTGNYNDQNTNSIQESNYCSYTFDKQMIKDNKPNLEFRIIDTRNPFPGKTGEGRIIGSNWCDGEGTCTSVGIENYNNLTTIQNNIINRTNSNGINGNGDKVSPKYIINLNYNSIKDIREYNNNHDYSNFSQVCDSEQKCGSRFLRDIKNKNYMVTTN